MEGTGAIVPPSIEITERISCACVLAVFGGGPAFGVMNGALAFFVREEGQ